jgi:hypothetical protein
MMGARTYSFEGASMTQAKKSIYLKFKMNTTLGSMKDIYFSEDRSAVDEWKGDEPKKKSTTEKNLNSNINVFQYVSRAFYREISSFSVTAPFIMNNSKLMMDFHDDRRLREFAKTNGTELEKGEFELYELDIEYVGEVVRRLGQSNARLKGISILPGLFLSGLISAYDVFLSKLLKAIFLKVPELLSSSERNISFKELVEMGSVEIARERIIEKEVESVIRLSHADQILWIEKKLDMKLTKDLEIWPEFIEICERRNLITHTGGAVSSQYLTVCRSHGCDVSRISIGEVLAVEENYYRRALAVILEMGMKLTQVVWRKLVPSELEMACSELGDFCYNLIKSRKYQDAKTMLEFGLYTMKKHGSEASRKRMVINYANAIKLDGDKDKALKILEGEDWSATNDAYKICIAAVKDEAETVIGLMYGVVQAKLIEINDLRDWPVFEPIRKNPKFVDAFEACFGEKLVKDRKKPKINFDEDIADSDFGDGSETAEESANDDTDPLEESHKSLK